MVGDLGTAGSRDAKYTCHWFKCRDGARNQTWEEQNKF
jgi:uncharacterized protein YodC (DUF2158 family)